MLNVAIRKQLGDFQLDVAFTAREAAAVLFGPSGSGKSLTLQCIAGLVTPDSGCIQVAGRTVYDAGARLNLPARERRVGYVFQSYALFPHLTVAGNVGYGLHRLPAKERALRVAEALRLVRLDGLEGRKPGQLSGGQQQRVALARAVATRPDLLLLDEPFTALDTALREELRGELLALLAELKIAALLVTHDLTEAYALGREIVILDAGSVLQCGPREDVYHRPRTRRAAELVGVKNFLPGRVERAADGYAEIACAGLRIRAAGAFQPGAQVECCIRPEDLRLVEDGAAPPGQTRLECMLLEAVAYGGYVSLRLRPEVASPGERSLVLHAAVSTAAYESAGGASRRQWTVVLDAARVHVLPRGEGPPQG